MASVAACCALVSAYAVCDAHSPCHGITRSGVEVQPGVTIAADWTCPAYGAGSWLRIEGVGERQIQDTGGAIRRCGRFDLYMTSEAAALRWGLKRRGWRVIGWSPPGEPLMAADRGVR